MFLGEIIKQYREEHSMSQRDFAKKSSMSHSYIAMLEKNIDTRTGKPICPTLETIKSVSIATNISIDVIMKMLDENQEIQLKEVLPEKTYYMCPVYGKISAGIPNWAEECIEGRIPIDCDMMNIVNPEEHFFLRVDGESMNKVIRNGAFALIHKQDYVENGEIAVVLVNGFDATLKHFTKQGDTIILSPDSTDNQFTMQIYDSTTPIKILGKYIGKMEINK